MINFFNEDIVRPKLPFWNIKKWIKSTVLSFEYKTGDISVIFCSDKYLLTINQTYLNHDYYTDIITFNYNTEQIISGDIFISVETVKSNAIEFHVTEQDEFLRVIIHGVLHLLGFNDHLDEEIAEMRKRENIALELYRSMF